MFSPVIRIILSVLSLIMAWNFYKSGKTVSMIFLLFAVVLFILGYFKHGTVYAALQQIKKENYLKAEKLLLKIKKPNYLTKSDKSYYHFVRGFIELNKDNLENSIHELETALNIGLRTENDNSIATLNLAVIELKRKNFTIAKDYISKTKGYKLKPYMKAELEKVEKEWEVAQGNLT